jgi:flavin reductase (DIM6/NTAB) family NADH-FMN oxidoreductase RutF
MIRPNARQSFGSPLISVGARHAAPGSNAWRLSRNDLDPRNPALFTNLEMSHNPHGRIPIANAQPFDELQFRHALGRFVSGVTVLNASHEGRIHGMTASAFTSVSLSPPLVLVSLDNRSNMHAILPIVRRYGISVLAERHAHLSDYFAGQSIAGPHVKIVEQHGVPLLEGAVAHFVVEVLDTHPAGDHTLYISRVEFFEAFDEKPLVYFASEYRQLHPEKIKSTPSPKDEQSLFSVGSIDPPVE